MRMPMIDDAAHLGPWASPHTVYLLFALVLVAGMVGLWHECERRSQRRWLATALLVGLLFGLIAVGMSDPSILRGAHTYWDGKYQ